MLNLQQIKQITKREGFKKYFKNTSWLFAEKILRLLSGLLVGILVARYLGPSDYGLYNYAFSVVAIFSAIAALGLNQIVVRELVKQEDKTRELLGTSFYLKLGGAILSTLFVMATIFLIDDDSETRLLVIVIALSVVFTSFNVVDYYFQSKVESKFLLYSNMISISVAAALKVYLVFSEASLLAFAWVVVVENFVLALFLVYYFIRETGSVPLFDWQFNGKLAKSLLQDSWPLIFGGLVLMIQSRIDQLMLKEMISNEVVGHYSVALRMIEIFGFIPMMLQNSLMPSLVNSKKASYSLYANRLANYYRINFIFFLLIAIPMGLFADQIISILFGESYMPAAILLSLMSFRLFFTNMGVSRSSYLVIENLNKFYLLTMAVGTVVNVILNFLWIPKYEAVGSVLATLVSFAVTLFLLDFFHKKARWSLLIMLKSMLSFYRINLSFLKDNNSNRSK